MSDEVRVTSPTGGEKGAKSARFGGGDPLAYMELARVYGMGEAKYSRYNYLKGYQWSLSVDALLRHLFAFLSGEERDPESGLLHTAHVAWHGLTLTSFQLRGIGEDDRPPTAERKGRTEDPTEEGLEEARRRWLETFVHPSFRPKADALNEYTVARDGTYVLTCCGATEHTLVCPRYGITDVCMAPDSHDTFMSGHRECGCRT